MNKNTKTQVKNLNSDILPEKDSKTDIESTTFNNIQLNSDSKENIDEFNNINNRIIELHLMIDGARYRKEVLVKRAQDDIQLIKDKVSESIKTLDQLIIKYGNELQNLNKKPEESKIDQIS